MRLVLFCHDPMVLGLAIDVNSMSLAGTQKISKHQEVILNLVPRGIWPIAQQSALHGVFRCEHRPQVHWRKQGVAVCETHLGGREIAPIEVRAADAIIVCLDRFVLGGFKHREHLRLRGQLREIVVVPRIRAEGLSVSFEYFNLPMNSKHFLYESASKVK